MSAAEELAAMTLDDLLAEDAEALDFAAEPEPIDATDLHAIDRRLATLASFEGQLARFDRVGEQRQRELADRLARGRRQMVERIGWLTRSLQITHQAVLAADPKLTRVIVPSGVLTSGGDTVEWVWPDENTPEWDALVTWIEEHEPAALNVPAAPAPRPDKNALKAICKDKTLTTKGRKQVPALEGRVQTEAGEFVPGVTVRLKPRTFDPKPSAIDPDPFGWDQP